MTTDREAAIIAALDAIEAAPPPCLPDALCVCSICTRYCALWAELERVQARADNQSCADQAAV